MSERRNYLIAYDIANPKRLTRLHRQLKKYAVPIQYSVFLAHLTEAQLAAIDKIIRTTIDETKDDVRIYPLPKNGYIKVGGRSALPAGISLTFMPPAFRPFFDSRTPSPEVEAPPLAAPRRKRHKLTPAQKIVARHIQARVQTGERRGILFIK